MSNSLKALYLEIISSCNCRCTYCYNENILENDDFIDLNTFNDIIEECKSLRLSQITISGGEPFLHDNIIDFIRLSVKNKIRLNIITNLTVFDEQLYSLIIENSIALQVTIDGHNSKIHDYTRGNGTFVNIIKNLYYLKDMGYRGFVTIRMNLHMLNYEYIEEVVALSKSLNCKMVNLSLLNKVGAATRFNNFIQDSDYKILERINESAMILKNKYNIDILFEGLNPSIGCPYYGNDNLQCGLRISPDGYVFPCQLFTDKVFNIGNVKDNSLLNIINGEKMNRFKTLLSLRKIFIPECSECAYQAMCFTGCPGEAYNKNNNIFTNCGKCDRNKSVFNNFINNEKAKY